MPLFIAGLVKDRGQAERLVTQLLDAGVPSGEISIAVREEAEEDVTARDEMVEEEGEFARLAVHSAWERLGWQGGARPPYRDRVPPDVEYVVLAAGPLAIAIGGAQIGASAGGVVGAMTNFGFPLDLAREWNTQIVSGRSWVMVRTTEAGAEPVRRALEKHRAELRAESLRHW